MACVVCVDTRPALSSLLTFLVVGCTHLQFPEIPWNAVENSHFSVMWGGYTLSFERVLAQWEAGNFDQIRPSDSAQPLAGLTQAIK